ncbi:MAG: STN domain-containing protein, partial [Odoribacter sp.]
MKKNSLYPSPGYRKIIKLLLVMKFTCLFLFLFTIQSQASVYSQEIKLDIHLKNATLKQVINEIKRNSEFSFVYSDIDFSDLLAKDIACKNATVDDILNRYLKGSGLIFSIVDKTIVIK